MATPPLTTNDRLRRHVLWMVKIGFQQKALASAMGIHPSKLNRWLYDTDAKPLDVDALDKYRQYVARLGVAGPSLESDAPFRDGISAGGRRKTGT